MSRRAAGFSDTLRRLDAVLRDALRRDLTRISASGARLPAAGWALLPEAVERHGITLWVNAALRDAGVSMPDAVAGRLRDGCLQHALQALRSIQDLKWLASVLERAEVPWLTFKGPVLADYVYPERTLRTYGDLDVLVDPRDVRRSFAVLRSAGVVELPRDWTKVDTEGWAETSWILPGGTHLDLHWALLGRPSVAPRVRLDAVAALNRARVVNLGDVAVPTLDATDQFEHLCVHAILSGGSLLRHVLDVHVASVMDAPDWRRLAEDARSNGTALMVDVMVQRTSSIFQETTSPSGDASAWLTLMRWHDRVNPPTRAFGRHLAMDWAVSATRESTSSSLRELAHLINAEFWSPMLHDPEHPWHLSLRRDPQPRTRVARRADPQPVDAAARDRFLLDVERKARGQAAGGLGGTRCP